MSSTPATRKKTRSASKSIGGAKSTPKIVNDSNLNGENDTVIKAKVEVMDVDKTAENAPKTGSKSTEQSSVTTETKDEKPIKGRKRKGSELKLNNSVSEEPPAKNKPVPEPEADLGKSSNATAVVTIIPEIDENPVKDNEDSDAVTPKETSAVNDSFSETPPNEAALLGKGKRARIPNKRYSDFPLKTPTKINVMESEAQSNLENGLTKENIDNSGSNTDASENSGSVIGSPNLVSGKFTRASTSSSPAVSSHKKKSNIDLSNPNYLKPFQYGWKRELVYRATLDSNVGKRNGDIYYYTPSGRKVRSMREVAEHLKNKDLTLDDFTFTKEPLGLDDPEKEIIRDAKNKSAVVTPIVKKVTPKVTPPKTPKASTSPKDVATPSTSQEVDKENNPNEADVKKVPRMSVSGFKIKLTRGKSTKRTEKRTKDDIEGDVEGGTYPPWTTTVTTKKTTIKVQKIIPAKKKKRNSKSTPTELTESDVPEVTLPSKNYLQNVAFGYSTLLYIFQYLKVQDLLHATCVCSMWRDIASHPILWNTVRMKNSQIHSFIGLTDALCRHRTVTLDLRKMLLPNTNEDIWLEFSREVKKVETLRRIELCRCPAAVIEGLAVSNPNLEVINAVTIKCECISLAPLVCLKDLKELRLKSTTGFSLNSDLTALSQLTKLEHLSLTSIKDLNKLNIEVIAGLTNLESLDLGECSDFPVTFGSEILTKLVKLEKLRLEKGQGNCYTFEILDAVRTMTHIEQLELVNFDIKIGFDKALGACKHIKKLLIIPTYISQSATTNHMVLGGVLRLQSNLSHFVWGITLELLRVTELFVDQCEDADKKEKKEKKQQNGDSIPVLKPVPLLAEGTSFDIPPAQDPPQVEILPLPNLQKLLLQSLPTTRVKILKIPFHATWRQSITDTVN